MKIVTLTAILASMTLAHAELDMEKFKQGLNEDNVIEMVSRFVKNNPEDITALVKEAIIQTDASAEKVAEIVEAAIKASPDDARMIYVAALSVAPDAHDQIMGVYNKYVVNAGGYGDAKSGLGNKGNKGDEVAPAAKPNPLDLPEGNVAGAEKTGGQGDGGTKLLGREIQISVSEVSQF